MRKSPHLFCLSVAFLLSNCILTNLTPIKKNQGSQETEEPEDVVSLHLFQDDERVLVLRNKTDISIDDKVVPMDVLIDMYAAFLDLELAETFLLALEPELKKILEPDYNLALVRPKFPSKKPPKRIEADELIIAKEQLQRRKAHIRSFEFLVGLGRRTGKLIKFQGIDYKTPYFQKEVQKKWNDNDYSKFDAMPPVIANGKNLGGDRVYLGMAPTKESLQSMRIDMAERFSINPKIVKYEVISMMENFEFHYIKQQKFSFQEGDLAVKRTIAFKKGRFHNALNVDTPTVKNLGVYKWDQFSTPDRTMLTSKVLDDASESLTKAMKNGRFVYVHCKSGKGRSATVVATARVKVQIDEAKASGKILTKSAIDSMISEQTKAISSVRSLVGISTFQKTNMQRVLYERAFSQTVP